MKTVNKLLFQLSGADYLVIKNCSKRTQVRYRNLALALILTVTLAFIGGYDIASQFTSSNPIRIGVAALWAIATLSFDYFLINSSASRGFFKYFRILVGFANICITISALFVLLNQATIDSQIRLNNSAGIRTLDDTYLKAKENRYALVEAKKKEAEKYNSEVVLPEARNLYPGPKYADKKRAYDVMIDAVSNETSKLDTLESQYLLAYQTERTTLESIQSNDFFAKAKMLPEVMQKGGLISIGLASCLFIFLGYIELQAITLKLSMSDDDEYRKAEENYERLLDNARNAGVESNANLQHRKILLEASVKELELSEREYKIFMSALDDKIVREAEIKGMSAMLRTKGYVAVADYLTKELARFVQPQNKKGENRNPNTSSETKPLVEDILRLSGPMAAKLRAIQETSVSQSLAESIFNWIVDNIGYDRGQGNFFYKNARETYNEKHGTCGELALFYMAFLRASGIAAKFVNVTKDPSSEEVSHACVLVQDGVSRFLSDPAYNCFEIKHFEWREWSDEVLAAEYLHRMNQTSI